MEIPFDYILIHIMIDLRNRKIKTKILKQNLAKIIDKIIYDIDISEKEKLETINNFDFEYELDTFYNNHIEYFELTPDSIILDDNVSIYDLEDILESNDTDELILNEIDSLIETDISIIELMGIKIRKDLYKWLYLSLKEDDKLYRELLLARTRKNSLLEKQITKQIKKHVFIRRIFLINLENLETESSYDLSLYSDSIAENVPLERIPFNTQNDIFDERNICCSPFQRALFFNSPSLVYATSYKLGCNLSKTVDANLDYYKDDYKFYHKYYYLLCEETEILPEGKLKSELEVAQYRLMVILDGMFDNMLFMNVDNNNIEDYEGKYKFNELEALFFIDEILSYDDKMYEYKDSYVIEYFNIIKKVFIKTYYSLTKDNNIISKIKENKLYSINKTSAKYFDDILNSPRRRVK